MYKHVSFQMSTQFGFEITLCAFEFFSSAMLFGMSENLILLIDFDLNHVV